MDISVKNETKVIRRITFRASIFFQQLVYNNSDFLKWPKMNI